MAVNRGQHPFDLLTFNVLWVVDGVFFEVFDGPARLSVRGDKSGPEAWQRAAFDAFWVDQRKLKPLVYEAILTYYLSIVEEYREQFGPEFQHLMPLISSVAELKRVVTPEGVYIGDLEPSNREVDLLFRCTWDDSHGLAVRIVNGVVAEVGPQDICL